MEKHGSWLRPLAWWACGGAGLFLASCGDNAATPATDAVADVAVDTGPGTDATADAEDADTADAAADVAPDTGVDVGVDAATDAGIDAGEDAATDAGVDVGVDAATDAGVDVGVDAATDAGVDVGVDAATDAGVDADVLADAASDAGADAEADAAVDALADATKFHPATWLQVGNPGFHGTAAKQGLTTCAGCHGAKLDGGTVAVSCNTCHSGWQTNCTFCHGGKDNQTGAPPLSTTGETATTAKAVGAHTTHVTTGKLHAALDCAACHVKPVDALSPGHVAPSPATVIAPAGWDAAAVTCANACHGSFPGGNAANKPIWTQVDGTQAACGTCHALPPTTGRHPAGFPKHAAFGCSICHDGMVDDAGTALVTVEQHVNGVKDVKIKVGGTWDPKANTCAPACHTPKQWQ